jgi:hypothetical protein
MSYDYAKAARELVCQVAWCDKEKEADALVTAALKEAAAQTYLDIVREGRKRHGHGKGIESLVNYADNAALRLGGGK